MITLIPEIPDNFLFEDHTSTMFDTEAEEVNPLTDVTRVPSVPNTFFGYGRDGH